MIFLAACTGKELSELVASSVKRALITGGGGFIGSNLADQLIADGVEVVVYDNFRTGRRDFLEQFSEQIGATVVEGDVFNEALLHTAMEGCDTVFHLQASADVQHGLKHRRRDLEQNTLGTSAILEGMRSAGVERIVFSSTGSIYGEPELFPTPEDCPFPIQTSLYGASKAAAEGLIGSYCHAYDFTGVVLRFVSVLGERYTHGHAIDFYRALRRDAERLKVLGDGRQRKSYVYVGDCVKGILAALSAARPGELEIFNLGTDETVTVDDSIDVITQQMGVSPIREYAGGPRGWPGDSPLIHLDCSKLRDTGWQPTMGIRDAVGLTVEWFEANQWVLDGPADREAIRASASSSH